MNNIVLDMLWQGFIQPQKSVTHYFLVFIALCFDPYRTISEKVVPIIIMSTKNFLKGKEVVTCHRTVDEGGRGFFFFFFFVSPFFFSFFLFFRFFFLFSFSYRPIFRSLPHYFLVHTALFLKKGINNEYQKSPGWSPDISVDESKFSIVLCWGFPKY